MSIIYSPKQKNFIINGNFDIWQRGTSQTISGYGSADRWRNVFNGSSQTLSRQTFINGQTDVPYNPTYYMRSTVSSISGTNNLATLSYNLETLEQLSGSIVTLSFWAKADSSKNIATEAYQYFGSGGSTPVSGIGVTTHSLTTSWKKFTSTFTFPSISGKTFSGTSCTIIHFWFDAGSTYDSRTNSLGQQSGTFDISQVQLEKSPVYTRYDLLPNHIELERCQRYYEMGTFVESCAIANANGNYYSDVWIPFKVYKRINNGSIGLSISYYDGNTWAQVYPTVGVTPYSNGFKLISHGISSSTTLTILGTWAVDADINV